MHQNSKATGTKLDYVSMILQEKGQTTLANSIKVLAFKEKMFEHRGPANPKNGKYRVWFEFKIFSTNGFLRVTVMTGFQSIKRIGQGLPWRCSG